ncbi:acyltransferase [Bdellovibrio sp. KM01]|uniref:acyltransferase family protein n=1 Tax=Bdellovibrio sp. KM01 TaxID=2748865 RepID=UPI0015E99AFC|nr:acyltransferase [Bdellovibrio sp. KM01]QLY27050.1 acyltransferase [Bdellovibrio sp. KM01]
MAHSPQLDGIRFFAFFLVFLAHTPRGMGIDALQNIGWIGVDLFFILSAYLLTSIMLLEINRTGSINLKHFFVRRCLRIWPLYFIALFFGFFVFPYFAVRLGPIAPSNEYSQLFQHFKYFLTFSQNISTSISQVKTGNMLAPLWSIATEEQFYVIFPFIIIWFSRKGFNKTFILQFAVTSIALSILFKYIMLQNRKDMLAAYLNLPTRIEPFMLGILLAIFSKSVMNNPIFRFFNRNIWILVPILIFWSIRHWPHPTAGDSNIYIYLINGVAFGILIISANIDKSLSNVFFSSKILTTLGKYTYGLYVWHAVIIYGCTQLEILNKNIYLLFITSLTLTVLVAKLSYDIIEKRFLRLKQKFR